MKERLVELIEKTEEIEGLFHSTQAIAGLATPDKVIYDVQEFRIWIQELKLELQEIFDRTRNQFIWGAINDLAANFNGWDDKRKFDKVKGNLFAIKRNIEMYYPEMNQKIKNVKREEGIKMKKPKIFISHSSKDKNYVLKIVSLLDDMGLNEDQIFCSSIPGYDIPMGQTIFDYLRNQFEEYNLHIIFIHSTNYYESAVSLNEMGAAWVLKSNYTSILLPGFEFSQMKGVVNGSTIALKLDSDLAEVKDKLNQLYDTVVEEFSIRKKRSVIWEEKRDSFIHAINTITSPETKKLISLQASELLEAAVSTEEAVILKLQTLSGGTINAGKKSYSSNLGAREFAKYESALEELLQNGMIQEVGKKGEVFKVTNAGFEYLESSR